MKDENNKKTQNISLIKTIHTDIHSDYFFKSNVADIVVIIFTKAELREGSTKFDSR